ncbi:hypothetical protein ANN_07838 [Periplaneta americana]|uniref:Uncharacterized protein n=1 Tax=Periplaneta americana TaxID=6978 RepID=A0ABQ8T1Z3_PERAM|nr:hypothetical protein ANN_07838 [Periplaneta americana]
MPSHPFNLYEMSFSAASEGHVWCDAASGGFKDVKGRDEEDENLEPDDEDLEDEGWGWWLPLTVFLDETNSGLGAEDEEEEVEVVVVVVVVAAAVVVVVVVLEEGEEVEEDEVEEEEVVVVVVEVEEEEEDDDGVDGDEDVDEDEGDEEVEVLALEHVCVELGSLGRMVAVERRDELGVTVDSCSWISIMWSPSRIVRFSGAFPDRKSFTCNTHTHQLPGDKLEPHDTNKASLIRQLSQEIIGIHAMLKVECLICCVHRYDDGNYTKIHCNILCTLFVIFIACIFLYMNTVVAKRPAVMRPKINIIMKPFLVQRHTRTRLYKTLTRPVLRYGSEEWTLKLWFF